MLPLVPDDWQIDHEQILRPVPLGLPAVVVDGVGEEHVQAVLRRHDGELLLGDVEVEVLELLPGESHLVGETEGDRREVGGAMGEREGWQREGTKEE